MAIINTKIVNILPETTQVEANTQYLVQNSKGKFDVFVTDNNKVLKQLEIDTNDNLLRQSATFMSLNRVLGSGYITVRLWDATPVIYGMWNSASGSETWGVHSDSIVLNSELFLKDLRNKTITVSVDVKSRDLKAKVGLGVSETDVTFQEVEAGVWTRISKTYSGTRLVGIWAKLADGVNPTTPTHQHLSNAIYFKNWKVEEGSVATSWIPASTDYIDSASHYVKTYQLPTTGAFRTDTLVEGQFQNGKTIGLANANTTVTIAFSVYTFKVRYLFLHNNSTLTLTGTSAIMSNSDQPQQNVFKGNRGDYVDVEFFQDQVNAMQVMAWQTKISSASQTPTNNVIVFPNSTGTLNLTDGHIGKTIVFRNLTSDITLNTVGFPDGSECSVIKLSDDYKININPAPIKGTFIDGKSTSSAYLLKVGGQVYIKNNKVE